MDQPNPPVAVGIAWYRPEQWTRLREVSVDRANLEETFEEWRDDVLRAMDEMEKTGIRAQPVLVDVEELVRWCRQQRRPVDGGARAAFAAELAARGPTLPPDAPSA